MQIKFLTLSILPISTTIATNVPRQVSAPAISIQNGTVVGRSDGHIDSFSGIPYAQPPVKGLRLKPPQSISTSYGTFTLPNVATACPNQQQSTVNTIGLPDQTMTVLKGLAGSATSPEGEDCLTVNVQRPANTPSDAKLPVVFWIYGGGFEVGSTQPYDGSTILNKSIEMNAPVVYVAVNYRVSAFGFMGGKQLQADGSTNLGLRDQRLALHWVAENIAAFGGDPEKITIWVSPEDDFRTFVLQTDFYQGESAGSISVYTHLLINHGDNTYKGKALFRGAIMDSGSILNTLAVDSPKAQAVYDEVVAASACSSASDSLECLRLAPYDTLYNAANQQPSFLGYNGNSVAFAIRPDPTDSFFPVTGIEATERGEFAKVPVIIGDQEDEGTLFSLAQNNLTTTEDLVVYFQSFFPEAPYDIVSGLVAAYSDNPADGSPFGTGDLNQLYPQFKKLAAINSDFTFIMPRRQALETVSREVSAWSYLSTYFHGLPFLGTYHVSDIGEDFDLSPLANVGDTVNAFYVNFFNTLNPNGVDSEAEKTWPRWDCEGKQLLNISSTGLSTLKDDFRQQAYYFISTNSKQLLF